MKKILTVLLMFLCCFFGIEHTLKACWADAKDCTDEKIKIIAHKIVSSLKGKTIIENHIRDHELSNTKNIQSTGDFIPYSYFCLKEYSVENYQKIIRYVIRNGKIDRNDPRYTNRFSISCIIPENKMNSFKSKDSKSIGAWMRNAEYKKVQKVKVVFSLMNMKKAVCSLENSDLNNLMKENEDELNNPLGDLITAFPILNHWN